MTIKGSVAVVSSTMWALCFCAPAVAGTIPCANLAGPGVLNVGGDGKGTGIFLK